MFYPYGRFSFQRLSLFFLAFADVIHQKKFVLDFILLSYIAGSYSLSISYILVYICHPNLPIHHTITTTIATTLPSPLSSLDVHAFVLHICVSISALQTGSSVHFSRFHIYVLIYDICFSLSDLLHSV